MITRPFGEVPADRCRSGGGLGAGCRLGRAVGGASASAGPNTHDNTAGIILLDQVAEHAGGTVRKALVDQGFKNQVVMHGAGLGIDVEIVERNPQDKGFVPQRKRWRSSRPTGS